MKIRPFYWVVVPLLVGLGSYFATGQLHRAWSRMVKPEPLIEYPARIDLGEHELGDQAIGRFTIANRGAKELILDEIQSNCSCTGMEREQDGRYGRVESLRLKAGEQAELVMRVAVRGVPVGAEMNNVVHFRTNDPTQPAAQIEAVVRCVSGGISATPSSIVFGTISPDDKVCNIVDVHDNALTPRSIERVTSTQPDRVIARLLPREEWSLPSGSDPTRVLIGRIEVRVDTQSAGEVNGVVQIHLSGATRKPDTIAVIGRMAAPIEISPARLILPRASTKGPLYDGTCVCRSTSGQSLSITAEYVPPGVTVEILDEGKATRRIRITWDRKDGERRADGPQQEIRLRTKTGDHKAFFKVQLLLQT